MREPVKFSRILIAPCGMNCGTCHAYLRKKNSCPGCRVISEDKSISVQRCKVPNCKYLQETESKFCYECELFPCERIKQLDKRYKTKYNTSFVENLLLIKDYGIKYFLDFESERRTCTNCGAALCVHRSYCLNCKLISGKNYL